MADQDIRVNVVVDGEESLKRLSSSLKNLTLNLGGAARVTRSLDATQRNLTRIIGNGSKGLGDHAKNVRQLASNHTALSKEIKRINVDLKALRTNTRLTDKEFNSLNKGLKAARSNFRSLRARTLSSDLRSIGIEMKRLGKDAQFVGRSLIIGLTTPLLAFANKGLSAFTSFERELVRLTKILGPTFTGIKEVEQATLDLSNAFGISRDLITGVTADFAELGINSADVLNGLTKLSAEMSILGSMDVSDGQQLTQTMFLGTIRTIDKMSNTFLSAAEKHEMALKSVTSQMYLFNAIENMTALSFRDMADSLPEVTAASHAFGLSMTQSAALLAPMKAAGIEVSVAANGIKVALQRLVTPTKKVLGQMDDLVETFGNLAPGLEESFNKVTGVGMSSLQGLIDTTLELRRVADDETILTFYADLFGKRQSTRMLTAIESMAQFQREMEGVVKTASGTEPTFLNRMIGDLNNMARAAEAATGGMVKNINNVESLTLVTRVAVAEAGQFVDGFGEVAEADIAAARQVRQEFRNYIEDLKTGEGIEAIEQVTSEAGKAFLVELAGAANAQAIAQQELDTALNSTAVSVDRMKIAFKNAAADLVSTFGEDIKRISERVLEFSQYIQDLPSSTKRMIAVVAAAVAAIGPLVFIFGQLRLAGGVALTTMMKFVPGLNNLGIGAVAGASKMLYLKNGITVMGDSIVNTNSKFATMIATIASGNGPIAKMAQGFGRATGMLSKHVTAADDVVRKVGELSTTADKATKGMLGPNLGSPSVVDKKIGTVTRRIKTDAAGDSTTEYFRQVGKRQLAISAAEREFLEGYQEPAPSRGRLRDRAQRRVRGAGRAVAAAPGKAVQRAMQPATKAIAMANAEAKIFGKEAPGAFKKTMISIKSMSGSIIKATKITKLFRFAMMSIGIGAIMAVAAAAIIFVIQNFDALKQKAAPVLESLKVAFNVIKEALKALIAPIFDLIASLLNMGPGGAGGNAVDGLGGMMTKVGTAIEAIANAFKWVVENMIVPVIRIWTEYIYIVVEAIVGIVKAIIKMKDNVGQGFKDLGLVLLGFFEKLLSFIAPVLAKVSDIFFDVVKFIVNVFEFGIRAVVEIIYFIPNAIIWVARKIVTIWSAQVNFMAEVFRTLSVVVGEVLGTIVDGIAAAAQAAAKGIEYLSLGRLKFTPMENAGQSVRDFFTDIGDGAVALADTATSKIEEVFKSVDDTLDDFKGSVVDGIHSMSDGIDFLKEKVGNYFRGLTRERNVAEGAGAELMDALSSGVEDEADEVFEPLVPEAESAGEDAGDAFADKFAEALKELKQRFVDLVGDVLTDEISDVASNLTDALQAQRDAALKVFDDQLSTIEALGKAEESLLRQKEFIANQKKLIDERELNRQNYVRNRALAIYEGRIDDARMLDLEEQKSQSDHASSLEDLTRERNNELRKENLEFLKDQIKETRKEADEFFKAQVKAFQDAAKEITKFAPQTIEDYERQLGELKDKATDFVVENGAEFKKTFNNMRQTIRRDMPNKVVGIFEDNLDDLLDEAKAKYGLNKQSDSVIGATISMLTMVGDEIDSDTYIHESWTGLLDQMTHEIVRTGAGSITEAIVNYGPQAVLLRAIEFANETILHGWRGTIDHMISEVDGLAGLMDPVIEEILKAQLAYEALRDAASAAADAQKATGTGGGGGGGGSSPVSIKTPSQIAEEAAQLYAIEAAANPSIAGYLTKPKVEYAVRQATAARAEAYAASVRPPTDAAYRAITRAAPASAGARMLMRANGGYVPGFRSAGIPAVLHGGEYVLNAKAVQNLGISALNAINGTRFSNPGRMTGEGAVTTINKTENINIYVDNFIGEERWFETMMDSYNVKVKPIKEKSRGEEVRVFNSYNYRTGR